MPEIVYTDRRLISEHGVKPRKVSETYANRMVQGGFARVINESPKSNPPISMPEHPIINVERDEVFSGEQNLYTFVSWLESGSMNSELLSIGDDCGFHIKMISGNANDVSDVLISDVVVINVGNVNWQYGFRYSLKVSLFQRLVPFVTRWYNECEDTMLTRQLATRARLNIFENHELAECVKETVGDLMHPYMIYRDPFNFWREISKVIT